MLHDMSLRVASVMSGIPDFCLAGFHLRFQACFCKSTAPNFKGLVVLDTYGCLVRTSRELQLMQPCNPVKACVLASDFLKTCDRQPTFLTVSLDRLQ